MRSTAIASFLLAVLATVSGCDRPGPSACGADLAEPSSTVICEGADPAVPGPAGLPHTLTVTGLGVAVAAPDVVHMQLGVQSRDAAASAALAANQGKLERIRGALARLGVAAEDIQIASYALSPSGEMDPMTGALREASAFVVDNVVSVALRDPRRVHEALGEVVAVGATSIQAISFTQGDPQRLAREARALAMADARARAEQMAAAAGVTLGRPLSIQEIGGSAAMFPDLYGMGPAGLAPTPGKLQHSMSVTIAYRIP